MTLFIGYVNLVFNEIHANWVFLERPSSSFRKSCTILSKRTFSMGSPCPRIVR
jgi:hypothetical protein